jgi:hypothetical protein
MDLSFHTTHHRLTMSPPSLMLTTFSQHASFFILLFLFHRRFLAASFCTNSKLTMSPPSLMSTTFSQHASFFILLFLVHKRFLATWFYINSRLAISFSLEHCHVISYNLYGPVISYNLYGPVPYSALAVLLLLPFSFSFPFYFSTPHTAMLYGPVPYSALAVLLLLFSFSFSFYFSTKSGLVTFITHLSFNSGLFKMLVRPAREATVTCRSKHNELCPNT